MNKTLFKLLAIGTMVVVTLVIVITSSYAWFSMSTTPSTTGLQIKIGSNTILVAPDIATEVDGQKLHYPGSFSDTLNFSKHKSYEYLNNLTDLALVSTADGINWYLPTTTDGDSTNQGIKNEFSNFLLDDRLLYSNLEQLPDDDSVHGGYALVDFWVVSPKDCKLRISMGDSNGGSFLMSLPKVVEEGESGYGLDMSNELLGACARVGFLANTQKVTDLSMDKYVKSGAYNSHYRYLKGVYQEKGESWNYYPMQFTIYEPNADFHHSDGAYTLSSDGMNYRLCDNGSYVKTMPIGNVNGNPQAVDITRNHTIQTRTEWLRATQSEYQIEQIFQTFLFGEKSLEIDKLSGKFYKNYLGYQCGTYMQKGQFIKSTDNLTKAFDLDGVVSSERFKLLNTAGATDDIVIVDLEKNVPQRIRMFVWIEGQDVDCQSLESGGSILLSLELAGGND